MHKCINQIFRPTKNVHVPGMGDCTICQTDKDNVNCSGYNPTKLTVYQINVIKNGQRATTNTT